MPSTMQSSDLHYFPLAMPFLLALFAILAVWVLLIELHIFHFAYQRIGIGHRYAYALLFLSLLGSYVNIPIAELPPEPIASDQQVSFFGVRYIIPAVKERPGTIVAVNLGGAIIPTLLSLYLLIRNGLYVRGFLAVAIVTVVIYQLAQPLKGIGIAVPIFVPGVTAAGAALALTWLGTSSSGDHEEVENRQSTPLSRLGTAPLAYISGSLGTLLGADLLNLDKIQGLGAPIVSIGGAGTFDSVFLAGILAVLLA
jgi:uncharacterized membrane protein